MKTIWWTKSNFLGLFPECGKDQWGCNIVNYYVAHTWLTSCDARRLFSSFSFWLDKGTLRCGDNFWSDSLRSIELVVKTFQRQETQFSPQISQDYAARTEVAHNLLDGMNRLAMGTILSMVLQPFFNFAEYGLHAYTLTRGQGWAANRTQYISWNE